MLQPMTPQGDTQGWSDNDDGNGGHHTDGVQFAGSMQTTPSRYHIFRTVIFVFLALSLLYLSSYISRSSLIVLLHPGPCLSGLY
jgi:hypothetical protein